LAKTLAGETVAFSPKDIVVGQDFEKAVAYGLAIEAREQRRRALKTHNAIGPCVFGRLFFYTAQRRDEAVQKPYIKRLDDGKEVPQDPGLLLGGAVRIGEFGVEFEVKLSFRPHGALFYWFCDREDPNDPQDQRLNLQNDVLRLPPDAHKTFYLKLQFSEDGLVEPVFRINEKEIRVPPFECTALRMAADVESYAGIDLGTSNSYAVNLLAEARIQEASYPAFTISESVGARLRELEQRITEMRACKTLTSASCLALAHDRTSDFVFHSIKIEGSGLSRGDTDEILDGRVVVASKEMTEPVNVREAYEFILVSHASYKEQPEGFIREINRIALKKIDDRGGAYRVGPVKISGTEFEPPQAGELPPHMERLAAELKTGPGDRTVVHFAAEMHTKLVWLHPFVDGNGRTARLLMNAILVDAGLPPGIINFQDKERYLDCLAGSNNGDLSGMVALLTETVDAALDELVPREATSVEVPQQPPAPPIVVEPRPSSQRLAEVMRKRIASLPADRQTRYEAWRAGFEAFREEFRSRCETFNQQYANTPFRIRCMPYDTLPFEKYESLLQGTRTPRTWLLGVELLSEIRSERFVFFFQALSDSFRRAAGKSGLAKSVPPTDVALVLARRSDGVFHRLLEEPIKLREAAYSNGQLLFLFSDAATSLRIGSQAAAEVVDDFLADAVEAFL
jgi:fido (protein-threonine AMPylation protein)